MKTSEFSKQMKASRRNNELRLLASIHFKLNQKNKTRLVSALGARSRSTLLTHSLRETHAARLKKKFFSRWGKLSKKQEQDQLRFLTILDCVCGLDQKEIAASVKNFQKKLLELFGGVKGINVLGVFELEVVNFKRMRELSATTDEARKLEVCSSIRTKKSLSDTVARDSGVFVHCHLVVDLGIDADKKHRAIVRSAQKTWTQSYQVQLGSFHENELYQSSTIRTVKKNLNAVADYMLKAAKHHLNEYVRYKIGFGSDANSQINRSALKDDDQDEFADSEDHMSLTLLELRTLGQSYDALMGSSKLRDGYLFNYGQQKYYR